MLFVFVPVSERKKPGWVSFARLVRLFEFFNFLVAMVAVNDQGCRGPSGGTPTSNTGLNCLKHSDDHLTVRIDWLQLSTLHQTSEDFQEMLKYLEAIFCDQIVWNADQPIYRGRRWDSSGASPRGIQVCFDFPKDVEPGRGWVLLPGSLLAQICASTVHDVCQMMSVAWCAVSRRLDVAVDDFTKPFNFRQIYDEARAGNVARIHKSSVVYHASAKGKDGLEGESVVLGSSQSDKRVTFYNKFVESNGEIDSHRVEIRLRDSKADQVFQQLVAWNPEQFVNEAPQYLVGVVVGAVHFVDRSETTDQHIDRLPMLDWWADFVRRAGSGVKLAAKKPRPVSIERKVCWLLRDVAPSLAILFRVFGERDFRDFIKSLLESGDGRIGKAAEALIKVFKFDWYGLDEFGDSIHSVVV